MKPNNAGKDMWQGAQTGNKKTKQNAQTQKSDGVQAMSLFYMTLLEAVSQQ